MATEPREMNKIQEGKNMTNAQMAHKMGLDKVGNPAWEYKACLEDAGIKIVEDGVTAKGLIYYEGEMKTSAGMIYVYCGGNGTARIDKPNGNHKWVYEKTPKQIAALIKKIIGFYK